MNFKTLLIYPKLGSMDAFITYPPLSLIYAAADSVKAGKNISILDLRFHYSNFKEIIDEAITPDTKLVGLSVMTGSPIKYALEISSYVKTKYNVRLVWGGAHPTVLPEETLKNSNIDFVVRGYGSETLLGLINALENYSGMDKVVNLYHKKNGQISSNSLRKEHELIPYPEIPYKLLDMEKYFYGKKNNRDIPIFTSLGCPYQCTFCISPAISAQMRKKWVAYENDQIIEHIDLLTSKYHLTDITVFDDDSFVDLKRISQLFHSLIKSDLSKKIKINFRGVRINELDKMSEEDIALMAKANTGYIMIGLESGSQKMLNKMKKGISIDAVIRVNKKLAHYPTITPHYNFFCGIPGETIDDLILTKDLLLRLMKDNPTCYLGFGTDWKPIPGSEMTNLAVRDYNLKIAASLGEWAEIDSFDAETKIQYPWYTDNYDRFIRMIQCSAGIIDRKLYKEFISDNRWFFKILGVLTLLYRPIIMWRLRHAFSKMLVEFPIREWLFKNVLAKL